MLFKLKAIKVFLRLISLGEQIVKMPKQTDQLSELLRRNICNAKTRLKWKEV